MLGGGIVVLYSAIGGMWSITLTDIIQFFIMTVGMMLLLAPMAIQHAGGWSALQPALPPAYFSLTTLGWPMFLAFTLNYFLGIMIGQDIWQRVLTARSTKAARYAGAAAALYCVLYGIAGALIGMAARASLPALADPNLVFATIVRVTLPVGLRGLVVAAALAAMMSTLATDRASTLAIGVIALCAALVISDVFKPLTVAYDLLVGSMLVPIIGAIYLKRPAASAAIVSMLVSAGVTVFFLARDGLDANLPIFYGLSTGLLVYCGVSVLRQR